MNAVPERLTSKPSWLITQLAAHARRLVSDGNAATGAGAYHYRILATLQEFGHSSQVELARRGSLDRSDVVAAINELAEKGFVERSPDPDDRRRNLVSLTKAGSQQLRRMDRALDKVQEDLLEPLSPAERQALTQLLTKLLTHHRQDSAVQSRTAAARNGSDKA